MDKRFIISPASVVTVACGDRLYMGGMNDTPPGLASLFTTCYIGTPFYNLIFKYD